jgi:N-acetylglutamate synthase-like GNAT family acetyltransferase
MDEAALLTHLCVRSKKFWGYDRAFMARSRPALTVKPGQIAAGDVWVAEDGEGAILGVGALSVLEAPDALEVDKLFVAPERLRCGAGRLLMARLIEEARSRGARRLMILSDPNAAAFYERMGASCVGQAPSDAIPGRTLPLYELGL